MGADQDAIEVGTSLGVSADHSLTYGRGKSSEAMRLKSGKIAAMRRSHRTDASAPLPAYTAAERADLE